MQKYKVTCSRCKNEDTIFIDDLSRVGWQKSSSNFIISARARLDRQWGFQCICGNNDIMTKQEKRQIRNPQMPNPKELEDIIKNLQPDKPKFAMEKI